MKRLGQIFRKSRPFLLLALVLVLLVIMQPWKWLGFKSNSDKTESIASRLLIAMGNLGTDEKEMFELLTPLSKSELISVYQKFGNESYLLGQRINFLGSKLDLFGWFARELSEKDLTQMRDIWVKSGIDITF